MSTHTFDQSRRPLVVADARLTKLMQRDSESCASINEYAQRTGIDTSKVLELLSPYLGETLRIEIFANEMFLHTAPAGRPTRPDLPEVAPNLWERLRSAGNVPEAYSLWRLYRGLELAGWRVEANPHRILFGLGDVAVRPALGVYVNNQMIPLVLHPAPDVLAEPQSGPLSMFDRAGAGAVGVVCESGGLDDVITSTRRWGLLHQGRTAMRVITFEAPRYSPVILTPGDASVRPRSISQISTPGR